VETSVYEAGVKEENAMLYLLIFKNWIYSELMNSDES
jgi:hypothetical protein